MIERKDSLAFIEFIRGKYHNIMKHDYIQLLINRMSKDEKNKLINHTFNDLWNNLWIYPENINYKIKREYSKSKVLFDELRKAKKYNLEYFVEHSTTSYTQNEWELPKGRRENKENNRECAIREVKEETNIKPEMYSLFSNITPINEEYTGINNVRYKHNYYIGKMKKMEEIYIDNENKQQFTEVKDIKWFTKKECLENIRDYDNRKKDIILSFFTILEKMDRYVTLEE